MQTANKKACPICGKLVTFKPHPERPGRVRGYCTCNPVGPVIETNAPPPTKRRKQASGEQ
ncbi:MAG: hypothetical protein KDJ52_00180 [Anaerolineae bacterium]|nr:hypothetical protein [Anaerolineae bacterium]